MKIREFVDMITQAADEKDAWEHELEICSQWNESQVMSIPFKCLFDAPAYKTLGIMLPHIDEIIARLHAEKLKRVNEDIDKLDS